MVLVRLFIAFFRVGLFAIGGAYSFLPLIEKEVVESFNWLTKEEFLDVLGMTRVFPGAISIKYATYTGYKIAGLPGAIVANLGNILAPSLFILFATFLYAKYKNIPSMKSALHAIELALVAMLVAVAFQAINIGDLAHPRSIFIIAVSFALFLYTNINPAIIIICVGIIGAILR